jgi:hypothetical protein
MSTSAPCDVERKNGGIQFESTNQAQTVHEPSENAQLELALRFSETDSFRRQSELSLARQALPSVVMLALQRKNRRAGLSLQPVLENRIQERVVEIEAGLLDSFEQIGHIHQALLSP